VAFLLWIAARFPSATDHHRAGPGIILQGEPADQHVSYTTEVQGDKMILLIIILTALFILTGISPLLVTEETRDIVMLEQP
jgi:hypothetical protein